ncbi:MAG: hypothetical protein Q8P11_00390 [bacterium]|nr:hypothetical protein [bacterium]
MYNWSTDTTELKKNTENYAIWKLEQMVSFGLSDQKLDKNLLKKYFDTLAIDPGRKAFLSFLLAS